jgi:hypothetical protein
MKLEIFHETRHEKCFMKPELETKNSVKQETRNEMGGIRLSD